MDSTNSSAATTMAMIIYFLIIDWLVWVAGKILSWSQCLARRAVIVTVRERCRTTESALALSAPPLIAMEG